MGQTRYLSPGAEALVSGVSTPEDEESLLALYEEWSSSRPASFDARESQSPMLRSARKRMGFHVEVEDLETLSEALDSLSESSESMREKWHIAKLTSLCLTDREKVIITIGHLSEADFDDARIQQMYLAAITGDDEAMAVQYMTQGGYSIHPLRQRALVEDLLKLALESERRDARVAAKIAASILAVYQNHREPPDVTVLSALTEAVAVSDDPGSFAAAADIHTIAIERNGDVAPIVHLLEARGNSTLLMALVALRSVETTSVAETGRFAIRSALERLLRDRLAATSLSSPNREWAETCAIAEARRWSVS
jgi:hypothetical protein